MYNYYILCIMIQYYLNLLWNCFSFDHWEFFHLVLVSFWYIPIISCFGFCFNSSLFSGTISYSRLTACVLPTPVHESTISSRSPGSPYWRIILETKILALGLLVDTTMLLFLCPLSWQNKEIHMCIYVYTLPSVYNHIYKYFHVKTLVSILN